MTSSVEHAWSPLFTEEVAFDELPVGNTRPRATDVRRCGLYRTKEINRLFFAKFFLTPTTKYYIFTIDRKSSLTYLLTYLTSLTSTEAQIRMHVADL